MKNALLLGAIALTGLVATSFPVKAELGQSYQKTCAKYGAPHHRHGNIIIWYLDKDFSVEASFNDPNKTCDAIWYLSWAVPFSEDQLKGFIGCNVDTDDGFREENTNNDSFRFWESLKRRVQAVLQIETRGGGQRNPFILTCMSEGYLARYNQTHPKENQAVIAPAIETLPQI